jgi:aldehyde dehydrogenase (NAD+)
VFGKFLNCGQTCVAPDYILCDKSIKDELVKELIYQTKLQYGESTLEYKNYGKIINEKHFQRICSLIDYDKVVYAAQTDADALKISPTVMDNVLWNDKVMSEEIFGPILPIITYDDFSEIFGLLEGRAKPLALYLFSEDKRHVKDVTERLRYGGGCINDTVIHLATTEMGFGGVGESGMGAYHGKVGFDTFSHHKSIVDKKTLIDLPIRYAPYKKGVKSFLLRLFLR